MRSVRPDDLTTRARVRDAAIDLFGRDGFATGLRAISAAAGVSVGLVNHHYGSKAGLRQACDEHVLAVIRETKSDAVSGPPSAMIAQLAELDRYTPILAYIVRSFTAGGALANEMFERMVDDASDYLAEGVAAGTILPSRDPRARAVYLTRAGLGGLLLHIQMRPEGSDVPAAVRTFAAVSTLPALELYTDGLLTGDEALAAYLATDHQEKP